MKGNETYFIILHFIYFHLIFTDLDSHSYDHTEDHLQSSDLLTDIVIGMSDGLTVPFALAAGLSGAVSTTTLIVIAGIAEIAAGSIDQQNVRFGAFRIRIHDAGIGRQP